MHLIIALSLLSALLLGLTVWFYVRQVIAKAELQRYIQNDPERMRLMRLEWELMAQKMTDKMSNQFAEENSLQIAETRKATLTHVVEPVQKELERLQKILHDNAQQEAVREERIVQTMQRVSELNHRLGDQAEGLVKALKGDNKFVGDFGEVLLERLLEFAGLRRGEHFVTQGEGLGLERLTGGHLKPDFVLLLPESRCIVVDAKMSLLAWTEVQNSVESTRIAALEKLRNSIRNHINDLSSKPYTESFANTKWQSLDFKFLFIPIEAAFHAAIQFDTDLYRYAFSKGIVLSSPTTLLATLTTIQHTWKQYDIGRNAQEISERAGRLLDKLQDFMQSIDDMGKHLRKADDAYVQAKNRLSDGQGNLIGQAEKLRELGAKGKK